VIDLTERKTVQKERESECETMSVRGYMESSTGQVHLSLGTPFEVDSEA